MLDDSDKEIINHVEQKILSMGDIIIPFLESEWEENFDPLVQRRIEELIHHLQLNGLKEKLIQWKDEDQNDLLKGVWLIASYQYPDLDLKHVKQEIDKIYYEAWINHRTYASPYDKVKNLRNVFFDKLRFSANTQNFHAPGNSMINIVMETRKGNPIALSIIYMLVAQRLKMPIYGVNLPNFFVLTYKSEETQFYINVFNRGTVFSKPEIDSYISQLKLESQEQFYQPCSNLTIIKRVLKSLVLAFEKLGESHKMEEVKSLLDVISN
ncbi:MAG: transglutaminase-like domain-containing protein, partial [Bacteroidota bacterium]